MIKAFLVSDAHIWGRKSPRYSSFLGFLDFVSSSNATHLFILGDLLEFLYGDGKYAVKLYSELFDKLKSLSKKGCKIYYLYGNHDFNFQLPFNFIESAERFDPIDLGGVKVTMFHGDGLDPRDYKYRFLKSVVRSGFFKMLSKMIPNFILYKMANLCSRLSRAVNKKMRADLRGVDSRCADSRGAPYRDHAIELLKTTDAGIVVLSHTHKAELFDVYVGGQKKYYLNTGFFGEDKSYGIIDDKGVCLCVFNEGC